MLARFAGDLGMGVRWLCTPAPSDLIPHLLAGKGDVIAAHLRPTRGPDARVRFALPINLTRDKLLTRGTAAEVATVKDLVAREIVLDRASPAWKSLAELRNGSAVVGLRPTQEVGGVPFALQGLRWGRHDGVAVAPVWADWALQSGQDLTVAFEIGKARPVSWAVRPGATELLSALDHFLNSAHLAYRGAEVSHQDLPGIKRRRVIRVLAGAESVSYFISGGELLGFEYELIRRFARNHKLHVQVIVPPSDEELLLWLRAGKGDIVAVPIGDTAQIKALGLAMSRPYRQTEYVVVAPPTESKPAGAADLASRTLVVPPESAEWKFAERLREQGVDVNIQAAPAHLDSLDLIAAVANGEYELTVAARHNVKIARSGGAAVTEVLALGEGRPRGWVVRAEDNHLFTALNDFFDQEYRGLFFNVLFKKYFGNPDITRRYLHRTSVAGGNLSPYDETVREYARRYGFDWRLIVAQMYYESRFDPKARSGKGAEGLMQVMPRTAPEVGIDKITLPDRGIHAGVKYLARLRDRFERELPAEERIWFALAAYNAGYVRVRDARVLAEQMGLDPDRWFENVERALTRLPASDMGGTGRHSTCRCWQPVHYIQSIRSLYLAYRQFGVPAGPVIPIEAELPATERLAVRSVHAVSPAPGEAGQPAS